MIKLHRDTLHLILEQVIELLWKAYNNEADRDDLVRSIKSLEAFKETLK